MVVDGGAPGPVKGWEILGRGYSMGLDIGVVSIDYLDTPGQPMYRFMGELMADPYVGLGDALDYDDWHWDGGGNGESAFYEFTRDGLINRANGWATAQNLSSAELETLVNWIGNLPYRGDTIMLHLGF